MLLKWKKEKEMKKKMDVAEQAKKKPFRVVHVDTEVFPFQKDVSYPPKVCPLLLKIIIALGSANFCTCMSTDSVKWHRI